MNRHTVTIEQVICDTNLLQAWYKVRANQGCAGIDRVTITEFERNLFSRLALLRDEVHYATYRPLPLFRCHIPKKSGGKRPLSIPAVRDRVLHTAVALVLTPVFEAEFEECSYAYRQGRSVDMAVRRIIHYREQGFTWVVDADIHSYFDEIDHARLLTEVEKLVPDPDILNLIRLWLAAVVVDGHQRFTLSKGVPQGSPVAPLLANLYLDTLDEEMLGKNFRIVRFSDDFIILCRDKHQAEKALDFTAEVLDALKLRVNRAKTRLVDFKHGFRFLGVDFIRSLVIKTKYPAIKPERLNLAALALIPPALHVEKSDRQTSPPSHASHTSRSTFPETGMALAMAEAGISADDFPDQTQPVSPLSYPLEEIPQSKKIADHDPLLRTLYLMAHGVVLGKESERFVIKKKRKIVQRVPAIKVDQIMVFGNGQITTQAMQFCIREKIPIFLLSSKGRYYGIIDGFDTDPVLLQRDQFSCAGQPDFCLEIGRRFIRGKIANSKVILLRYKRKRSLQPLAAAALQLKNIQARLNLAESLDQLRGYEGTAARIYFRGLARVFDADWRFNGRTKHPPKDPINSMLSYGYTLLFYNMYSLLRVRGLNPHVGFLHPVRPGHPGLVSDIMEEFRSIVVDAVVINLVLNRRITPDQFILPDQPDQPCLLNDAARSLFIRELEKKFNAPLTHPRTGMKLDYRRCMERQVLHLAGVIQGRKQSYMPLVLK